MSRGSRHSIRTLLLFLQAFMTLIDCDSSMSLQIHSLRIPTPVATGDSVLLRCVYELGSETLYAVKWYKNEKEFFRYIPGSEPRMKTFPRKGIDVDMSRSDQRSVFLRNLSLESYGNYTCQVSTDKPFYRCVQTTRHLEVVGIRAYAKVPPSDGPVLTEEKSYYELGDNVSILCNSGKSRPAPDLKWYINDQLAQSDQQTVVRHHPDQLESSSLALRFRLQQEVLQEGRVVLKCIATLRHLSAATVREITTAAGTKVAEPSVPVHWTTFMAFLILWMVKM